MPPSGVAEVKRGVHFGFDHQFGWDLTPGHTESSLIIEACNRPCVMSCIRPVYLSEAGPENKEKVVTPFLLGFLITEIHCAKVSFQKSPCLSYVI